MNKAASFHGIDAVKSVKRIAGVSGDIASAIDVKYAINLAQSPEVNEQAAYRDNRKVVTRTSNQGYTGTFGFGAQDVQLETAAGIAMNVASGGVARTSSSGAERFDTYYEFIESLEGAADVKVRAWMLNHSWGTPEENHDTDEDSIQFGEYIYPITIFGDPALKESEGELWHDANGMGTTVTHIYSRPGDVGYEEFANSVPEPVVAVLPEA